MGYNQYTNDFRFVMMTGAPCVLRYYVDHDQVSRQAFFDTMEREGRNEELEEFREGESPYIKGDFTIQEPKLL